MRDIAAQVNARTTEVCAALTSTELDASSHLPGWSRLTIACHLRYGASAICRMVRATRAGEATAYYPDGRDSQRPGTLVPAPAEPPTAVVESLVVESASLDAEWASLSDDEWSLPITEPGSKDLGPVTLSFLALLRLTEVEVHGTDLDLGLAAWSDVFVHAALPARLMWLNARAPRAAGAAPGEWVLVATDGPTYRVTASASGVRCEPGPGPGLVIEGTSRDLLALMLGRRPSHGLGPGAASFLAAFPGP
jgi:uncharacterized protein (TIGR03083 family)